MRIGLCTCLADQISIQRFRSDSRSPHQYFHNPGVTTRKPQTCHNSTSCQEIGPRPDTPGQLPSHLEPFFISNWSNMSSTNIESNYLLPPTQSGFRRHHSTETAIMKVYNDIILALDSGFITVLLDFPAAFDSVDHTLLLKIMQ